MCTFLLWILDHLWYLNHHHVYYFMIQFIICDFLWIFSSFLEFWEQMFPLNSYFCGLSDIWNVFIGNYNIVIVNLPVSPHIDTFLGCFKHHVRMSFAFLSTCPTIDCVLTPKVRAIIVGADWSGLRRIVWSTLDHQCSMQPIIACCWLYPLRRSDALMIK